MSRLSSYFSLVDIEPTPGDIHYEEGVLADLQYRRFCDIDIDALARIGAPHILLDLDGTLVPSKSHELEVPEANMMTLTALYEDPRFETISVATENGSRAGRVKRALGIEAIRVFSSYRNLDDDEDLDILRRKTNPNFWQYILMNLDMEVTPEKVVMIGDSLARDIKPAQRAGLKTVQVYRLEMQMMSMAAILKMRENTNPLDI